MQIKAIHQFHPACSSGDGVSAGMLFARRLLRELGFRSEIYCDMIPDDMRSEVRPRSELAPEEASLLLVHHSLGYQDCAWLEALALPKVLVYHNITPPHLLPAEGPLRALAQLGREQLKQWAPHYLGGIGDSAINAQELREAGFANVEVLPLLVDLDKMRSRPWEQATLTSLREALTVLFVGRVCENKHQLKLVEVLEELRHFSDQPVQLILAGGISSGDYLRRIEARIQESGLAGHVHVTGKVTDEVLGGLYRGADIFLCMSEHEGFGMPLIEAMLFDVPVLALESTSIPDTMGSGGLIFRDEDPRMVASLVHTVLTEPGLRRQIIAGQRQNIVRFDPAFLRASLASYLQRLGVALKFSAPSAQGQKADFWQVEGPFDSSYSLAIVNRELARAFAKRGLDLGLRSREGGGDFAPSQGFLMANPDCAALARRADGAQQAPAVSLRFCYPPVTDDMRGEVRAMHSYGWEETGFPAMHVAAFNRRLDMVSVLSEFVGKTLRDSGVRVPMAVTGGGVDHLANVVGQAPDAGLQLRSFRFLHVSSCFPRKGVDVLLRAFGEAFSAADDVSLVIKTFANPHNNVAAQLAELRRANPDFPHVVLIERDFSDSELVGLYQDCHAFVATSRGEGLGLPMAEAMQFRLPVITTAWGGQLDFCNEETAWLCDFKYVKARSHFGATHSAWAEPDAVHLAQLLREVFGMDAALRQRKTDAAWQLVTRDFTWARTAERIEQAVAALRAQPLLRKEPKIGWVSSWHTRCGIAAYSSFLTGAVPHDRLQVFANRTDERTAQDGPNVQRCWNQHHNESLDDLYDAIRRAGVEVVVIQFNFGFFSLAALGRLLKRLDADGIATHIFFHATQDLVRDGRTISLTSIGTELALAQRLYVHGIADLNRFKDMGLIENVVFFPQGVPPTPATDVEVDKQRLGLAGKRIIAAYGFLLPHKGVQVLIRAFARLARTDASLHLLLVTALYPVAISLEEKAACEALIAELGLERRVTLQTDFLEDEHCLALLKMADLVVYSYQQTQESSSAAVRMALAAARPVAVTPLDIFEDVAEVVHSLPGTDEAAVAEGMRALMADTALREKTLPAVRDWTVTRQWPLLSARMLNIIDGLANPLPVAGAS